MYVLGHACLCYAGLEFGELPFATEESGCLARLPSGYSLSAKACCKRACSQARAGCRYLRNITIPAVFIKKTEGQVLKDLLKPGMEDVYAVMDWNDVLPRADKVRRSEKPSSFSLCGAWRLCSWVAFLLLAVFKF